MTPLKLYWWKGDAQTNFGDVVSPIIVEKLSGRSVIHDTSPGKMIAVGSLLQVALPGDIIWGTGYIGYGQVPKDLKVYAVRGPKTREILLNSGIPCPEIYGDPGILLPHIFSSYGNTIKKYKYGIIPHYVDYKKVRQYIKDDKINVINILSSVENVILEANKCERLFSSSLHGIILGESFKIPTAWFTIGGKLGGGDFKFEDYYLSTQREKQIKLDWSNGVNIEYEKNVISSIEKPTFNYADLINSFPHKVGHARNHE